MNKLLRNLREPRHAIYKIGDVSRRGVPYAISRLLAIGNMPSFSGALSLNTYDGSSQACHPTTAEWHGQIYLALTPYPYGEEWYENPSVYRFDAERGIYTPLPEAFPVVRPCQMGYEHYSDPCLYVKNGVLHLLFRRCERRPDGKIDQLFQCRTEDGQHWSDPVLLLEEAGDMLISPAVVGDSLWCVRMTESEKTELSMCALQSDNISSYVPVSVDVPQDWRIWHIDVRQMSSGEIYGLFMLLKNGIDHLESKLAMYKLEKDAWHYQRDIDLPESIWRHIRYVYKSTILPDEKTILCSACDKQDRYILFQSSLVERPKGDA